MGRWFKILGLLTVFSVLSGCYLPTNFELSMQINKSGDFAFQYEGGLTHLLFLQKIGRKELSRSEDREFRKKYKDDLERDSAFERVVYEDQARYNVKYVRQGNINQKKTFSFARRNGWFFRMARIQPGVVEIKGNKLPKKFQDELISSGFDTRGTIRLWTDAKVANHNATLVENQGALTMYEWRVFSMRDPSPSMRIFLK